MQVIPAVDVLDGKVVRLLRGSFAEVTVYGDDPVAIGSTWIERGADLVHLVDLEGARSGQPDRSLWDRFAAAGVPFQVGGGIRDVATARAALEAGAERVVLGTAAVWNSADPRRNRQPEQGRRCDRCRRRRGFGRRLVREGPEPRSRPGRPAGEQASSACWSPRSRGTGRWTARTWA